MMLMILIMIDGVSMMMKFLFIYDEIDRDNISMLMMRVLVPKV